MTANEAHDHRQDQALLDTLIVDSFTRFHLARHWQIEAHVVCPERGQTWVGRCRWGHLPNACFDIQIVCGLSPDEMERTLAHEILEALMAAYADYVESLILQQPGAKLRAHLDKTHRDIRDALIEHLLCVLLGDQRDSHLTRLEAAQA